MHRGTNSAKTVGVCDRVFVGVVLTRNGGGNRRIFAFFTAVAVTPKATRRKAGVSTTCRQSQHKRIQNSECRMRNLSSVLFVLTKCGCLVHFLACHKREQAVFTDTENALCFASRTQITLAMATILRRRIA